MTDFRHLGIRVSDVIGLGVEESDEDVFEQVRKSVSVKENAGQ